MRWLLVKDLQLLRRSPLVTALLIVYPIAIAVLIGFSLSRGPEKPRVAFLNQVPAEQQLSFGGGEFDKVAGKEKLCSRVECVDVSTRQQAVDKVESGDVLGALILPSNLVDRLQSLTSLNPEQPTVEVLVNEEDPVKARLVNDRIDALLAEANLDISKQISEVALSYLDLLIRGGEFNIIGQSINILGLENTEKILTALRAEIPKSFQPAVDRVIRFAQLTRQNLDLTDELLASVREPIQVDTQVVNGDAPSLNAFAISIAATVTLMFVTVLLVAGSLALEREENAFTRLTRGLVGRTSLLVEKVVLGIVVALVVTLLMLAGLALFVPLDWGRFALWIPAIVAGGAGFAAAGAAIGGAAREVRAASLLAFMISLPIAFLSLVPSGTVSPGLFDVIEVVRAAFPFQPAQRAISGALDAAGPGLGLPILHLAILTLAYGVLARVALRRFA
jgi:ABC-2 type transport system permease protein